jgi:hypothetical protein
MFRSPFCDHHQADIIQCVPSMRVHYGIPYCVQIIIKIEFTSKIVHNLDKTYYIMCRRYAYEITD